MALGRKRRKNQETGGWVREVVTEPEPGLKETQNTEGEHTRCRERKKYGDGELGA